MQISARMAVIFSGIFAGICFAVALTGFVSSGDIADPVQRSDGYGFAWFWTFLGTIAAVIGGLSIWLVRTHREEEG